MKKQIAMVKQFGAFAPAGAEVMLQPIAALQKLRQQLLRS
jgi:hypothetical protein